MTFNEREVYVEEEDNATADINNVDTITIHGCIARSQVNTTAACTDRRTDGVQFADGAHGACVC